jgi:hypothetical protein
MESTAAEFTSDIPSFVQGRLIDAMLNLYETRFLPAAAGQLAAAQFQTAAQMDGEMIAIWHARLRTIFERAFPGENIQNSRLLINKFVLKLSDADIRQWTHRANPDTYNAAMTAASNEAASKSILAHEAGNNTKNNISLNQFGARGGSCFGCGSYEHQIAACPLTRPDQHCEGTRPRGRGRPRGGRGGRGRGVGGGVGVGFKRTYLQTRGRGGTRANKVRGYDRNNARNSVNGIGGEDDQYEDYYDVLHNTVDGGINGIGEDGQYMNYYKELGNINSNHDDQEQEQESEREINDDDLYVNYNLDNMDILYTNNEEEKHEEEESWEKYDTSPSTTRANHDQIPDPRWGKDWNKEDEEQIRKINQHFTRRGGNTWNEDDDEEIDEVNRHFNL